jgi:hypothetical protein
VSRGDPHSLADAIKAIFSSTATEVLLETISVLIVTSLQAGTRAVASEMAGRIRLGA